MVWNAILPGDMQFPLILRGTGDIQFKESGANVKA